MGRCTNTPACGDQAHRYAERVIADLAGDAPILVDSAGCGAAMKHYGELLDTDEARAFSARVFDVHEWLAGRMDRLVAAPQLGRIAGAEAPAPGSAMRRRGSAVST